MPVLVVVGADDHLVQITGEGVVTADALRLLAGRRPKRDDVRRAIVAPQDLPYGLGRMFEALPDQRGGEVSVFRDRSAATRWLAERNGQVDGQGSPGVKPALDDQ